MVGFLGLLFFSSIIMFIVGMVKPSLVIRWGAEEQRNRKKAAITYLGLTITVFVIAGIILPHKTEEKGPTKQAANVKQNTQSPQVQQVNSAEQKNIKYRVVYSYNKKRFDRGINLYVLMDPVDLTKNEYKEDVKQIVNKLVKENGLKTSIDFFDDKQVLDLHYKLWCTLSLDRNLTEEENQLLEKHHVATFSGNLSTGPYTNTLYYLPNANKGSSSMEYNPK